MEKISGLIKISQYAGMREDLVQAGGGNTSVKIDKEGMYIKASGYQLAEITKTDGYSKVNYRHIINFFNETDLGDITLEDEKKILEKAFIDGKKPSIEIFLHSITDVYTLHTHPVLVNILACRTGGMETLKKIFPDSLVIDYATPGIKLAKEYFKKYKEESKGGEKLYDIIFLKNHGLIVSAKTPEMVIKKNEEVLHELEKYLKINMKSYRNSTFLYNEISDFIPNDIVYLSNDFDIKKFLNDKISLDYWFCPDCLVYCGKRPLVLEDKNIKEKLKIHIQQYGKPVIVFYENNIYILAQTIKKAKEIESVLSFSIKVLNHNKNSEIDFLDEDEQNFLLNWDAEKYRQNMK